MAMKSTKEGTKLYLKKQQIDNMAVYYYAMGFSLFHLVLFIVMFSFSWADLEAAKDYDLQIRSELDEKLKARPDLESVV